jgi:hypothetical protein
LRAAIPKSSPGRRRPSRHPAGLPAGRPAALPRVSCAAALAPLLCCSGD